MRSCVVVVSLLLGALLSTWPAHAKSSNNFPEKTGAPGHGSCKECHKGSGNGSVTLSFSGGTEYEVGKIYSMMVTISDPTQQRWGFSMVARDTDDNTVDVGTWSVAPGSTDTRVHGTGTDPDSHVSHLLAPLTVGVHSHTFEVNWTAPAGGVGDVTFYVAANAANGDGSRDFGPAGSGLDNVYLNSLTIGEQVLTNQAPSFSVPGGTVDLPSGIATAITGISVDDPDAGSGDLTVDLTVQNGTLTIAESVPGGVGPAGITDNETTSVTLNGTLAELNATFGNPGGVVYLSDPVYVGNDTLQLAADDNGNTGPGGAQTVNAAITISVNPVTFAEWAAQQSFGPGDEGALADPDNDGSLNLREFFGGTDPLAALDFDRPFVRSAAGGIEFVYRRAKAITGVSEVIEESEDLVVWTTRTPAPSEVTVTDLGEVEEVAIAIASPPSKLFVRLGLSAN